MSDVDGRVAKAKIRDQALLEALEDAEEEHGSLAEALRHAVSTTYVDTESDETATPSDEIPAKARDAHRKLVEWAGIGGRLELDTAESVLANHLNIQKEAVRKVTLQPLKANNAVALHQGLHEVTLVVGRLDGDDIEARDRPASTSSGDAVADGGEARERLDELAEAVDGGESA
ncbi:hypothetical protein [Halorubrum tebenquichense]|uniref:Uncharacterized protein n=1 Tax=Halorubrum tebenquichense DSM 14210 TaxID=1227485 RepID=M0E4A1_9EURY|nr:hypothetical protein [Halorubrum tebenquichense]ELZ41883.1 hypothetical protein C472_00529 [Halorubrum tebenquichense DSM 14210]